MNVTMPDGTVIAGVPDGTTQTELSTKYQSYQKQSSSNTTSSSPTADNLVKGAANIATGAIKTGSTVLGGANAAFSNIGNLESELYAKGKDYLTGNSDATQAYQNSQDRATTQDINTKQAARVSSLNKQTGTVAGIGGGDVANFAGQVAATAPVAEEAFAPKVLNGPWGSFVAKGSLLGNAAKAEGVGQLAAAGAPTNAPTVDQSLQKSKNIAEVTAVLAPAADFGMRNVPAWFANGVNWAKNNLLSTKGSQIAAGNAVLDNTTSAQQQLLRSSSDKNTTAETVLNPQLAANERNLKPFENSQGQQVTPSIELAKKRQANKFDVGQELSNLNISGANTDLATPARSQVESSSNEITRQHDLQLTKPATAPEVEGAPLEPQAQSQTGAVARDISNTERQSIKDAYTSVAPDDTVQAPLESLQKNMDAVREQHASVIANDSSLSEIDNRYSSETADNTGSVKQMIQDKNALGSYINTQYRVLKNPNSILDAEDSNTLKTKIAAATDMRDALKTHLTSLTAVPSGAEGQSVSEAFSNAENKYKEYQEKYLENPEQYKVNNTGTEYNNSSSTFGDYDYRLQKGTAGNLEEEGKKLLPTDKPDILRSNLLNMRNYADADGLVKTNFLASMKKKGIDEVLTPENINALKSGGFENVVNDLQNIQKTVKANNYSIDQRNILIEQSRQSEQDKLEQTFAAKLVKGQNGDASKLLEDSDFQQQAIALADKQNDGGATKRGIGQIILDKIKQSSLVPENSLQGVIKNGTTELTNKPVINSRVLSENLDKYSDVLKQTIGQKEFNAIYDINKEAIRTDYVHDYSQVEGGTAPSNSQSAKDLASKGLAVSLAAKTGAAPATGATQAMNAIRTMLSNSYRQAMYDATTPSNAVKLMDLATSAKQPGLTKAFVKGLSDTGASAVLGAAGGEVLGKKSSSPQLPIDKQVQQVTKPQSKNEVPDEKSFLSQFSPISDANASELPRTDSKKNEFQIADVSQRTGMPKEYFKAVEQAETGGELHPDIAKAKGSSARGRDQFTESTWNDVASKHDLPLITDKNRGTKNDPRTNPNYSRLATGYYGSDNADKLRPWIKENLGRDTTIGDVYGAHFMGLGGFKQFMSADPNAPAAKIVPMAAKNNKSLFFDSNGKMYPVSKVYQNMEDRLLPKNEEAPNTDGEPDM